MKTIKPLAASFLPRVFEARGKQRLALSVLVGFDFDGELVPEVDVWKLVGEELGDDVEFEEAMPKPSGELLVCGKAFAPGGAPCTASEVRVEFGSIARRLYVVGDRSWQGRTASKAAPFVEMELGWHRAYGGPAFEANPLGKGHAPTRGSSGPVHELPNVEDPSFAIASPDDTPPPAGLGPLPQAWPQRQRFAGSYGADWLATRYPGLPDDFDPRFWSRAPEAQRLSEGFHRGDEQFLVAGMHPERGSIEGRLPGIVARGFVGAELSPDTALTDVALRLDTVWLFPRRSRGVLVFRGVVDVATADASEIALVMLALERIGAPRDLNHYRAVLGRRLDKDEGGLEALREADLSPDALSLEQLGGREVAAMGSMLRPLGHRERRHQQRLEVEKARMRTGLADVRTQLQQWGHPTDRTPADPFPPVEARKTILSVDDLSATLAKVRAEAEAARIDAEKQREEAMAKARAQCEAQGIDFDAKVAEAEKANCGPPKFRASAELARMEDTLTLMRNAGRDTRALEAKLRDPRLAKSLIQAEAHLREVYRQTAHHQKPAQRLVGDEAAVARASVTAAIGAREALSMRDLTGADLSGLSMSGMDLSDAHLESADLSRADLARADLTRAVLARADLSGAKLAGAKLAGANLGEANLTGADLTGADLTGAILAKVDLTDAKLDGATLLEVDLGGATFKGASLRGAKLTGINLIKADLRGLVADGADLSRVNLIECELEGVSLAGARLEKAVLVGCKAARLDLKKAELRGLIVVQDTSLAGSDLSGSNLREANLRSTNLAGCDLSHADLDQADLSGADLTDAKLYRVTGRDARFVRSNLTRADLTSANLLGAILQDAIVPGAIFKGANLFRADLFRAKGDDQTSFAHALVTQARFQGAAGGLGAPAGAGKS